MIGYFSSTFNFFHRQNDKICLRNGVGSDNFYPQLQIFSKAFFWSVFLQFKIMFLIFFFFGGGSPEGTASVFCFFVSFFFLKYFIFLVFFC